jgi:four helix bundle protein
MTNLTTMFPHERLIAYQVACELLDLVRELRISDVKLRDQAMRAAQSGCLNIAEAAGRFSGPDKARVFAIARGEACEVAAAIDIAARSRQCEKHAAGVASAVARRLYALLTGLIRRCAE